VLGNKYNEDNHLLLFYFCFYAVKWCHMIVHIIQLAKNGIILSWAVEGQGGRFHVNEHNNTAIVQVRIGTTLTFLIKLFNGWSLYKISSKCSSRITEYTLKFQSNTAQEFNKDLICTILTLSIGNIFNVKGGCFCHHPSLININFWPGF
jgi:hypothetical protein